MLLTVVCVLAAEEEEEDVEDEEEEEDEEPKTKTVKKTVYEWDLLNDSKALWLRAAGEVPAPPCL